MIDDILDSVSVIKLLTGETIVGLCVSITEEYIHFAFPYEVSDDVKIYNVLAKNRFYTFAHKDIIYFKEAKDEFKAIFKNMVLGTEEEAVREFRETTNPVKIPEGCFLHDGNGTVH